MSMSRKPASPRVNVLFSQAFQKRIRVLRDGAGLSQGEIAKALRVGVDAYKKYETRPKSMLPHQLVPRFIEAVGGGPGHYYFLYTGRWPEPISSRTTPHQIRDEG